MPLCLNAAGAKKGGRCRNCACQKNARKCSDCLPGKLGHCQNDGNSTLSLPNSRLTPPDEMGEDTECMDLII